MGEKEKMIIILQLTNVWKGPKPTAMWLLDGGINSH